MSGSNFDGLLVLLDMDRELAVRAQALLVIQVTLEKFEDSRLVPALRALYLRQRRDDPSRTFTAGRIVNTIAKDGSAEALLAIERRE